MQIEFDNYSISPTQEKDAWRMCDFVVSNEERLKNYFPKTLEQNLNPTLSQLFVSKMVKKSIAREEFLFVIKENTNRTIIGFIYVKELDKEKKIGELAYCMGYQYEGKRIMTASIKNLVPWCFDDAKLQTLQIIVHNSNIGSKKVAENNGFQWKQTLLEEHTTGDGEVLDMELYELHNPALQS
ncbi:GNAT family N-acetyltransferase [Flagellimonas pacifica]|uniref:Ribosomal-protein-alanine N-acetyltransferase n=1 Tax=Flagellimonas pacifica TaxID=1247520 RepID=A0A285MI22_9FLAO|nr:GNAT family protein [Allomuricauda parva]SNY95151.1 ribosomal-protein-alanine N-acetyltransferase [Allomuricauda parva]